MILIKPITISEINEKDINYELLNWIPNKIGIIKMGQLGYEEFVFSKHCYCNAWYFVHRHITNDFILIYKNGEKEQKKDLKKKYK